MDNIYLLTLLANIIIAIGIFFSIFSLRLIEKFLLKKFDYIVAFIGGVLSGIVFFGFIPKILKFATKGTYDYRLISLSFLAGMFIFFVIELFFHFHHCKDLGKEDCVHKHFSNKLMMLGTFIHNFLHGIVIYTGFLTNYVFGWLLTISIFLHSIPQNIANYLMNHKDLKGVLVAALGGIIGAAVLYPIREFIIQNKVYILACIAGMLLYLIISDILPEFKKRLHLKTQIIYLLIWILGFGFYILLEYLSKVFM